MAYIGNRPADKYQTLQKQSFTTSATDTYTLSYAVTNPQDLALFINNVRQNPNDAYTVSNTTLTLSSSITGSDTMYAVFLGRAVETVAPALSSVTNDMLAGSIANAKLANSSVTVNGTSIALGASGSVAPSDNSITMAKLSTSATEADNVKQRVAKVWVKFNGTGTPAIDDDFNVSSIGDGGTGIFTVNFSSNLGNANYALAGSVGGNSGRILGAEGTYSTSAVSVRVNDFNGNLSDETRNSVIIFGDS